MTTGVEFRSFECKQEFVSKCTVEFASNLRVDIGVNRYREAVNAAKREGDYVLTATLSF